MTTEQADAFMAELADISRRLDELVRDVAALGKRWADR